MKYWRCGGIGRRACGNIRCLEKRHIQQMIFKSLFKDEMRGQVSYDFVGSNPTISVKKMILINIAEIIRDFSYERSVIFI